jgi:hypothetical protein
MRNCVSKYYGIGLPRAILSTKRSGPGVIKEDEETTLLLALKHFHASPSSQLLLLIAADASLEEWSSTKLGRGLSLRLVEREL